MTAANTDKFRKATNNFSTTLTSAVLGVSDTAISIASTANLPLDTGIDLVIDRVDSNGNKTPSKEEYVKGVVGTGTVTSLIRGLGGSTAQAHSVGAVVESVYTAQALNDQVDGLMTSLNQDGTIKAGAVSATALAANSVTSAAMDAQTAGAWLSLGTAPTFLQNNGQKEQVLSTAVDLTGKISKGMKLKCDRPAGTPTQAMAFAAASSQYATKASPAGITFTSAFTCEAWINLASYTGGNNAIISRDDGTNGFRMQTNGQGQLQLVITNASTYQTSYQSVPLNRWVHVAATFSSGTFQLYINGILVPSSLTGTGTSITQAGNLQVGASNSINFFNGYISEARVWSVAQTQAVIRSNMAISLLGSETNLVALFQGNGNFNDKTSNANNLTATGGAIATQVANPYNTTEYGIVTNITSTQMTVFTGANYNIPSTGTLANFYYSASRAPFNFPTDKDSWRIKVPFAPNATSTPANLTWYQPAGGAVSIVVPTGAFDVSYRVGARAAASSGASYVNTYTTLSTTTNSEVDTEFTQASGSDQSTAGVITISVEHSVSKQLLLPSATNYNLLHKINTGGVVGGSNGWNNSNGMLIAECAYL